MLDAGLHILHSQHFQVVEVDQREVGRFGGGVGVEAGAFGCFLSPDEAACRLHRRHVLDANAKSLSGISTSKAISTESLASPRVALTVRS